MTSQRRADRPLVLHVVLSLNPGGAERLVINLCRDTRDRFRVAVCCLDEVGTWADQVTTLGVEVYCLSRKPGFQPSLVARLGWLARRLGASVMHCHQYTPFVYGLLARPMSGAAVVYTEHGRLSEDAPSVRRQVANRLLRVLPFRAYAVSCELRTDLIRSGLPGRRIGVIQNGVSITQVDALLPQGEARRQLGVPPEDFVVGTVARLNPVKDLGTLLAGVAQAHHPIHLVVIGDGPEHQRLALLARSLDVRTTFVAQRPDARRMLPAFDIFANTSLTEGISVTILEAMDARVPIVATSVGGTPEILEHDRTAKLIPPRSPEAVAAALDELAATPVLRERLSRQARDTVEARFCLASMTSRYIAAYDAVLHRGTSAAFTTHGSTSNV